MNKVRRKRISILSVSIRDNYSQLQVELSELESLLMEEEDAQESIPESLQTEDNEIYAASCQAVELMGDAYENLDSAIEALQKAEEYLQKV